MDEVAELRNTLWTVAESLTVQFTSLATSR